MRRALAASLVALIAAAPVASALTGGAGGRPSRRVHADERYGYSVPIPDGWRRARGRLVPRLLSPREILTLGTASLPVGGGGNCGREPVAAISRMGPGDALVTLQEYATNASMRARAGAASAPPTPRAAAADLRLRPWPVPRGERVAPEERLWAATVPFGGRGRWFDALVYVRGTPAPGRLHEVRTILAGLRLRGGRFVGVPG